MSAEVGKVGEAGEIGRGRQDQPDKAGMRSAEVDKELPREIFTPPDLIRKATFLSAV